MYRSHWELDLIARHRIADIATECQHYAQTQQYETGLARQLTHFRHGLGIGLIQIGQRLAGHDAARGMPVPSHAVTWGHPSF